MEKRWLGVAILAGWVLTGGWSPVWAAANIPFDATEQRYLDAYTLVRQAFEDKTQGRAAVALEKFQTARDYLNEIRSINPQWHSQTVSYLLADCEKQIESLEGKAGAARDAASQRRVSDLTQEMLQTIQRARRQKAGIGEEPRAAYVPSLSRELQPQREEPRREAAAEPVRRRESAGNPLLEEKVEALQAGFVSQKKEAEQWKLQYSILEEKSREEMRVLASEFAREKTQLESQIAALKQSIAKLKGLESQWSEKAGSFEAEKNSQQEMILRLKNEIAQNNQIVETLKEEKARQEERAVTAAKKIEELERALQEAQSIRTQAEEESRVREGEIQLKAERELEQRRARMEREFDDNLRKLEAESAKKLAEQDQKTRELEKKLVQMVKEQADREEQIGSLQTEILNLSQKNKEVESGIGSLKESLAAAENRLKESASSQVRIVQLTNEKQELEQRLKKEVESKKTAEIKSAKLEKSIAEMTEANRKLAEEKNFLIEQDKKAAETREKLELERNKLKDQIAQMEQELNRARYENAQATATVRNAVAQAEAKTAQLKAENEKVVMELLESFKKEKAKWQQDVSQAGGERQTVEALEERNRQLAEEKERTQRLGKLLENSEKEKKELYLEINRMTETVAQLKLDVKRLEDANAALNAAAVPAEVKAAPEPAQPQVATDEQKIEEVLDRVRGALQGGKPREALEILKQNQKFFPQSDKMHFYQGLLHSRLDEFDKAEKAYKKAIAANPKLDKAYNNLGNLYNKQGRYGESIENLKKAIELNPQMSEAFNNIGIVYSKLQQFDEAIKAFIRATEINPELVAAYYNLGQIYYMDGKIDAARSSFQKVTALEPGHKEAKKFLAQIEAAPAKRQQKIEVVQEAESK